MVNINLIRSRAATKDVKLLSIFNELPSFFDVKKYRPKTDLEKCQHCSVSIEISLELTVSFSL